jgi:coenzyme F420-reducing hydrogenase delta subunit
MPEPQGKEAIHDVKVVGFVCDWAVSTEGLTDGEGRLAAHTSVRIIRVPCSGFMRPDWLEAALRAGADGAFVTGCPYGDCLNREGNYLMRDRVEQLARRLSRRRVDPARLAMLAHGLHDRAAFLEDVAGFLRRLAALPAPAPAARPVRPASAAASAPAGSAQASAPAPGQEEGSS